MALALYRRYRPDTFEGVIGQDQVTVPLMRALDEGKLTHAYLFSGPRGCGKTSSARILARCVNCAKGPTSHPCGECESCKDLATGGPGSIDVVEIDAASHNGVDDARELRERAGFAPARDRYKIFILDEAHMVTQQGFNALLKIVEEPPEHVMFIFATTEPDKVIGTIRSRTHHYPFRLVPQEVMGPYLEQICAKEGIKPESGVLPLAMRAGGGSMRDTLSVLDQLMVGSVNGVISYDSAVALLGFTPDALIGEAIDAVIDRNGEALYGVIQKVIVGGFDPRRFVEDLLSRVRDLLVLTLAGERAESVLSDTAEGEDMQHLHEQAQALGLTALTGMADVINSTLASMTGAISPRMRLELLAARLLAGAENGFAPAVAATAAVPAGNAPTSAANAAPRQRGGFIGSSRNQQAQTPAQSAPVTTQPAAQAPVAQPAVAPAQPAAEPAQPQADTRTTDQKWDAALAALPKDVREYVAREKVPTVAFGQNAKGKPCLSLTFDKPLSQHAFALAVDSASGKKAAVLVQESVRKEFGADAVIAPTSVAANGETAVSYARMSPQEQAKVKQQIAAAKASAIASNLGVGLGVQESDKQTKSETKPEPAQPEPVEPEPVEPEPVEPEPVEPEPAFPETEPQPPADDFDPWAQPIAPVQPKAEPKQKSEAEEKPKKVVAVPDMTDDSDPWAMPVASLQQSSDEKSESATPADKAETKKSASAASSKKSKAAQAQAVKTNDAAEQSEVSASADEYSMNDASLGESVAMTQDDLKKMFDVKSVESLEADDPRNPLKAKSSKKQAE